MAWKLVRALGRWLAVGTAVVAAHAVEFALDGSVSSSSQAQGWGAAAQLQLISESGLGLAFGYQRLSDISYSALDSDLSHAIDQFELAGLWQLGGSYFRLQGLAGGLWSNTEVAYSGSEVISLLTPGFQLGADISVPLAGRLRTFAALGYQAWWQAEIPAHFRWRYGLRFSFGASTPATRVEEPPSAVNPPDLLAAPEVVIDSDVPDYMPSYVSQSIPPILANAEICKCYPRGPYTLQLGEFPNMAQAIRSLEYRGLRQFFNSHAYAEDPLSVFLVEQSDEKAVALYLGDLQTLEQLQYWRHELSKSGLQVRLRKVIMGDKMTSGSLAPAAELPAAAVSGLPASEGMVSAPELATAPPPTLPSPPAQQPKAAATNIGVALQAGPFSAKQLIDQLSSDIRQPLLSGKFGELPAATSSLTWDEGRGEAWLEVTGLASLAEVADWRRWLATQGITAKAVKQLYQPTGDVYRFSLGAAAVGPSIQLAKHDSMTAMLGTMRSPEVLWFQVYQRINLNPVTLALIWSDSQQHYQLVVPEVANKATEQLLWEDMTAVGLRPQRLR